MNASRGVSDKAGSHNASVGDEHAADATVVTIQIPRHHNLGDNEEATTDIHQDTRERADGRTTVRIATSIPGASSIQVQTSGDYAVDSG